MNPQQRSITAAFLVVFVIMAAKHGWINDAKTRASSLITKGPQVVNNTVSAPQDPTLNMRNSPPAPSAPVDSSLNMRNSPPAPGGP